MRSLLYFILWASFFGENVTCSGNVYVNIWAVKVRTDLQDAKHLAAKHGFVYDKHLFDDYHTFKRPDIKKRSEKTVKATEIDGSLSLEPKIEWFQQQKEKQYQLFSSNFNDPLYKDQWYFNRVDAPTYNITTVWESYSGKGILVAVIDDGVDKNHPELQKNYNSTASYDFLDGDKEPVKAGGGVTGHGNKCAGVIAGVANNNLCGVGIAYNAQIAGIRIFDDSIKSTDATEAKALVYKLDMVDIYSNSWGPGDMGWQVKGPGPLASAALKKGVEQGRNGLGAIYTFAAGNGGIVQDSCSYNGYVGSIYTIAINGVNDDGSNPTYAEECPAIMATAYSRDIMKSIGKVITADNTSKCSEEFGASSAAAAMASGLIALTLEANPKLSWRDVQYIIVLTSRSAPTPGGVELKRGDWVTNKAGLKISKFYGFGLMDADSMVRMAKYLKNNKKTVPPQLRCEIKGSDVNRKIPASTSISVTVTNCNIKYLEHVQIGLNLDFNRRGDLGLKLTSPSGTISPLTRRRRFDNITPYKNLTNWFMTTLFNWGEKAIGEWTLTVENLDTDYETSGTLYNWSLVLYGTSIRPTNYTFEVIRPTGTSPPISSPKDSTVLYGTAISNGATTTEWEDSTVLYGTAISNGATTTEWDKEILIIVLTIVTAIIVQSN